MRGIGRSMLSCGALLGVLLTAPVTASAYRLKVLDSQTAVRWDSRAIDYAINNTSASMDEGECVRAIKAAFAVWTRVEGAGLQLKFTGFTEQSPGYQGEDALNVVAFAGQDEWVFDDTVMAMTISRFDTETGVLSDSDILINDWNFVWSVGGDNDLQNALTHEVGHLLGLDHSDDTRASMSGRVLRGETSKRVLSPDDEAAVAELYPFDREPNTFAIGPVNVGAVAQPAAQPVQRGLTPARAAGVGCDLNPTHADPSALLLMVLPLLGLARRRRR